MLNLARSSPLALRSAAKSQLEKGQPQQAQAYVMEALSRDVNDHEALALLADSYAFQGMKMEAFSFFTLAVCAAPEVLYYKERFIVVATTIAIERYNETAERAILECLKTADVLDEAKLRTVWLSHLLTMPDMVTQYNIAGLNNHALATTAAFKNISDLKPLLNAFFLTGIRKFVIFRPAFEEFMSYVRKHLLDDYLAGHKKLSTDEFVTLASAVAQYSFNSDYILEETPDDLKKSEDLRARVEVGDVNTATIALLACYTPLFKLKNRKDLQATFATHADLGAVVKKQISDFENLHDIAKTIEAITPIDDAISLEVQKQYEEFPYPRWESLPDQSMLRGWKMSRQEQEIVGARVSKKGIRARLAFTRMCMW